MGNMRGLPYGFKFCGCDDCCTDVDFEVIGGAGETGLRRVVPGKKKPARACDEENKTCRCELFVRKKGKNVYNLAIPNPGGNVIELSGFEYKYFCVHPVLEKADTYALHSCKCDAPKIEDPQADPLEISCPDDDKNPCHTKCKGECCLFSLPKDDREAKWKLVADAGASATISKKVYGKNIYRCFCVST
jgi:hypothetical protein